MSMHLMKIRVTEKSNSKKWTSAEAKAKAKELEESWEKLKGKYESGKAGRQPERTLASQRKDSKGMSHLAGFTPPRGHVPRIPSREDSVGIAAKPEQKVYTGDKMIGIGTLHKSNAVPIFSEEEAKDQANMRR